MITSRDSNSNRPILRGRLPMSYLFWMKTKLSHNNPYTYIFVLLKEHDPILREVVIWCPFLFFKDKIEVKCSPFRVRDVVKARWLVFRRSVTILLFTSYGSHGLLCLGGTARALLMPMSWTRWTRPYVMNKMDTKREEKTPCPYVMNKMDTPPYHEQDGHKEEKTPPTDSTKTPLTIRTIACTWRRRRPSPLCHQVFRMIEGINKESCATSARQYIRRLDSALLPKADD